MKRILLLLPALSLNRAIACTTCNKQLQDAIHDSSFYPNLAVMLSAFFVLAVIVVLLTWMSQKKRQRFINQHTGYTLLDPVPLTTVSIILGIGLGGFIDGILFHQVLQWHEMLSNKVAVDTLLGKSVNMFWDGIFHLFCWIVLFIGIIMLWKLLYRKDINISGKLLSGGLLLGWGLFNVVEGLINHHLLDLHYVRQFTPDPDVANYALDAVSLVMIIAGWLMCYRNGNYQEVAGDRRV